ncbi:hypothetical protein L0Y69_01475 [bacterium]|nr:hypothetical protein [bacterium]
MNTVTIPVKEYRKLVDAKLRYEYLRRGVEDDIFAPPPTRDANVVVRNLKATGKYNKKFLESLKKGLSRSSYFQS